MARELDFSDGFTSEVEPTQGKFFADDGTAALPGITFSSDPSVGLFRPGAEILGFSTNGVERARIDSTGKFGIGATPTRRLQVTESASGALTSGDTVAFFERSGDAVLTIGSPNTNLCSIQFADPEATGPGRIIYNHAANSMQFRVGQVNLMFMTSSKVGIGSEFTTPNALLHIRPSTAGVTPEATTVLHIEKGADTSITISSANTASGSILFADDGDNDIGIIRYKHLTDVMEFTTNASLALKIDSAQNLLFRQVAAYVTTSTTSFTGAATINAAFNVEQRDTDSAFVTDTFTCPSGLGGMYYVGFGLTTNGQNWGAGAVISARVERSGIAVLKTSRTAETTVVHPISLTAGGVIDLAAGQTIILKVFNGGPTVSANGTREDNWLSIIRIANS